MLEPDPADAAFEELLKVRADVCLIVASWPGQADSEPYRAPLHVREQLVAGLKFPFIREATQSELRDYALERKLFSTELTAYLTKDWGSW